VAKAALCNRTDSGGRVILATGMGDLCGNSPGKAPSFPASVAVGRPVIRHGRLFCSNALLEPDYAVSGDLSGTESHGTGVLSFFSPPLHSRKCLGVLEPKRMAEAVLRHQLYDSALVSVLETLALVLTAIAVAGGWLSLRVEGLGGLALGLASAGMLIFTWLGLPRLVFWFGQRRGGSNPHSGGSGSFHIWSAVVVLYIILWVLHGGSIYFVSQAVLFAPLVDLPGAVFVMSAAWLIGFIAIAVPAGIGVRELTLATLLSSQFGLLPYDQATLNQLHTGQSGERGC